MDSASHGLATDTNNLLTPLKDIAIIRRMFRFVPSLLAVAATATLHALEAPREVHYYDETTNRHLTVTNGDFGKVLVAIRSIGGPGSFSRWLGDGNRKDKEIIFAQTVGEDQERGTFFVAKGGESKLEVGYKPGQREPQDAGINGLYRHITEEKRLSLARKEFDFADDALAQLFKTAPKSWAVEDRPAAGEWKNHWADLRVRWMGLIFKPAIIPVTKTAPGTAPKPSDIVPPEKQADYWIALSETTGMAIAFISAPMDKLIPPGWEGDYDDGFGGHVNLRMRDKGVMRVSLTCTRGSGDGQTAELSGDIPAASLKSEKNKDLITTYTHTDAELKPADKPAVVRLRKFGHFLFVETGHAERYAGRAWFDGIYRWTPPPKE